MDEWNWNITFGTEEKCSYPMFLFVVYHVLAARHAHASQRERDFNWYQLALPGWIKLMKHFFV